MRTVGIRNATTTRIFLSQSDPHMPIFFDWENKAATELLNMYADGR